MALAEVHQLPVEPAAFTVGELADALVSLASRMASQECEWLSMLAEFDRREGWFLDGQLSCVDWLIWKCGLSRATAYDKLRVAHELRRRPSVREAFRSGDLSYSKVRAIIRVAGANDDTDEWLLRVAALGTVADLERAVRRYEELKNQERGLEALRVRVVSAGSDAWRRRAARPGDAAGVEEHVEAIVLEATEAMTAALHPLDAQVEALGGPFDAPVSW